jgi:DNA-binding transcriptional regulator of glucitol operon
MRRLVTPGWLACHALAAVLVAGCLALGWWQIGRAAGGNALSWAYAVEWPVFAGFVVFIWWREVRRALGHEAPADTAVSGVEAPRRPVFTARRVAVVDDRDDPELAAYNDYLAWLSANPDARPADYPGPRGQQAVEEKTWAQP